VIMKKIKLTQGEFAIVDDDEFERLNKYKWCCSSACGETIYALRGICLGGHKRTSVQMHREIINAPTGMDVDHINGNRLDNRKENLRLCTRSQNSANQKLSKNNKTGFKGVSYHAQTIITKKRNYIYRRIYSQIRHGKKLIFLGSFKTERDAALAYDKKAIELFGEYALTNKMLGLL
jgi:hypothetical protein